MSSRAFPNQIAAYKSVSTHGGAASADPHQLISMLMDGALDRMAAARGCIERQEKIEKAALLHRVVAILEELRASLDHSVGGDISANLEMLYEYISRRVLTANLNDSVESLNEASRLLQTIRRAWGAIPQEARAQRPAAR